MTTQATTPTHSLSTFALAMITVAAIVSLRNLPLFAEYGLASIFYFIIASLIFFIPIALTTAELASGWPYSGGSYIWVGEAFGKRTGFFSLWMAWMGITAWYPAILAFIATMLAHLLTPFIPGLEHNTFFTISVMLSVFWILTFVNFLGMGTSSWLSTAGVILGTVVPGILIILLGLWWILAGHPAEIIFSWKALIPEWRFENMVFFSGILLGLGGVEVAAFHIRETRHPAKDFPKAVILAIFFILGIYILGTLAVALVIPQKDISLISGLIQSFQVFFNAFHLPWAVPVLALCILIGAFATINAWIAGPAKGLLITAQEAFLPPILTRVNSKGVPTGMLLFQAIVCSILSGIFLWMESHSVAYWILLALSAQFALVQYGLMFVAVLKLRYSKPNIPRAYQIPGGKVGVWLTTLVGITACLFGFWIVFVPPAQLDIKGKLLYQLILAVSLMVLALLPLGIALHKKISKQHKGVKS